jgi:Pyruvate/2-oxoacid:ferredoxin oxidoreductase delta subunit
MAHIDILYFSGTGNSLHAARRLAQAMEGARLKAIPIVEGRARSALNPDAARPDALGLVFPVQFLAMPAFLRSFVENMDLSGVAYIFAVATNGGDAGNALYDLDALLRAKGGRLNYGAELPMGDNSIVIRTSPEALASRMGELDSRINAISRSVANREDSPGAFRRKGGAAAMGKLYDFAFERYYRVGKGRADSEKCSRCALCSRICPVSNISREAGPPSWGDRCALCFACVNFCPQNAVSLGRIHPRRIEAQHRCPGIGAADLLAQRA